MSGGRKFGGIVSFGFGLLVLVGFFILPIGILYGMTTFSIWVIDWAAELLRWAFALLIIVCLSAVFPDFRKFASMSALVLSFVFGVVTWIYGLANTYIYFGMFGVFVGIMLFGIGPVFAAMLGALLHGQWSNLIGFIIMLGLTFGCRAFALWLAEKVDRRSSKNLKPALDVFR